jgi:hypothetical protein
MACDCYGSVEEAKEQQQRRERASAFAVLGFVSAPPNPNIIIPGTLITRHVPGKTLYLLLTLMS